MMRVFDTIRRFAARPAPANENPKPDNWLALALPLIQRFEGCAKKRADGKYQAYPDPATGGAPFTIGWGSTGPTIAPGTVWTKAQCDDRLMADLTERYGPMVKRLLGTAPATPAQFAAMVSFVYNLGPGSLQRSTLLRKHIDGNTAGAADEFGKWVFAAGKRMPGLVTRRAAEAELYRS